MRDPLTVFRSVRALVRSELRQQLRHRGRTVLMLLLVAVPVAAVVGGATLVRIVSPTDEERRARSMGQAALRVDAPFEYEEMSRLQELLPPEARVQRMHKGGERVQVPGRRLRAESIAIDPLENLTDGLFLVQEGEIPRNAGEVALSPVLLEGLERSIGEIVTLQYGGPRTITGVVVDTENVDHPLVVRTTAAVEHRGQGYLLVAMADGETVPGSLPEALRNAGFTVDERSEITGEGSDLAWAVFILGSIGFLEAGLVVAATFIVGLRRRQYEIGLAGSTGATVTSITSSLVASSGALAALGGLLGVALGSGFAALLFPFLDGWNRRLNGGFELSWLTVLPALVLGVLVALTATVIPSWVAARMPIRVALGGRRPIKTHSAVWLVLGSGMVGLGILMVVFAPREPAILGALAAIGGSVMGVLGFGVSSPFILDGLGRCAARLPLRWRLALRDAGRFRARNGPVVTAVLAGMSMSVTVAVLVASLNSAFEALPATYRSDQLLIEGPGAEEVASGVMSELSGLASARLQAVYVRGEPVRAEDGESTNAGGARQWVAVGDEDLLRVLGAEDGLEPFRAGRLLRLIGNDDGPDLVRALGLAPTPENAGVNVELSTWRDGRALDPLPVTRVDLNERVIEPKYLLHPAQLERLGWESGPPLNRSLAPWLVRLDGPVTEESLSRAREIAGSSIRVSIDAELMHQSPARSFYYIVQWLCILTGLIIVLVATALSSVESAADARILHAVGAAPRLLRSHMAARAGYLAFLGCLLALPAGLIPAVVLFEASNLPLELVVPWFDLIVALFALPLLAYAAAWVTHRDAGQGRWIRLAAVGMVLAVATTTQAAPEVVWEPYVGEAFDGSPLKGELGRIAVPEKHGVENGKTMELAFVRYRTTHPRPGPPVVFLVGGPGGSGVEHAGRMATHPQIRFLEQADFIGLDQRGTGLSLPSLETPENLVRMLPTDRAVTRQEVVDAHSKAARELVGYWKSLGVDPSAYNSRESADDVDALREALDLEQIILFGSSYGSHLGLAHLRRHPDTVARAILSRVEGPDQTMKLPSIVQSRLAGLDDRVGEKLPDLLGLVGRLLEQLEGEPVAVGEVVISRFDLQSYLSNALSTSVTAAGIPANLLAFSKGDWTALEETATENRRIELSLMPWAMDCASGATPERLTRILDESRQADNLLGDAILAPHYPETCRICPGCDLGDDYRSSSARVGVPVLFISGTLDVRTPPSNVDEIAADFPRHAHVLAENAGHESRELMSPEFRDLFQAFLRGEVVTSATVTLPSIPIELD